MLFQRIVSRAVRTYLDYAPKQRGAYFLLRKMSPWLIAKLDTGPWIRVSGASSFEWHTLRGKASPERATMERFLNFVKPGATVVDVGANIGYYTLTVGALIGQRGRVLALEPNPTAAKRLRENIQLNRLSNVTVVEAAAADQSGELTFHLGDDSEGSSLVDGVSDRVGEVTVDATTIDQEVEKARLGYVDVLKIDVEGAELRALSGARQLLSSPRPPVLFLEANPIMLRAAGQTIADMRQVVESFGYRITVVEKIEWRGETCENWLAQKPAV